MQAAQQSAQQQFYEYEDELDGDYDEEQEQLDENGDPIPSSDEVR